MAAHGSGKRPRCKCGKDGEVPTCNGCGQSFCSKHATDHRRELAKQMDGLVQKHATFKRDLSNLNLDKALLTEIDQWEKKSVEKIRSNAEKARADLQRFTEESKSRLESKMAQLASELLSNEKSQKYTEVDLGRWMERLKDLRGALERSSTCKIVQDSTGLIHPIIIQTSDKEKPTKTDEADRSSQEVRVMPRRSQPSTETNVSDFQSSYPSFIFGPTESVEQHLKKLLKDLTMLQPMDKNGPMSGKCDAQTSQMEQFLTDTFGFQNIPDKHIVQGVRAFRLHRPPDRMDPNTTIHFPASSEDAFTMTIREIIRWQKSFKAYACKNVKGMTTDFLRRALQGQSTNGAEAFLMKYVVRISTCPILMEFDAQIISRKLDEVWPHRIKLVSVTGIDFAGRKHDVDDILCYVSNWKDVYEVDFTENRPALANDRDFQRKRGGAIGILHEDRLLKTLKDMARVRLLACDAEGVQIVVETGIGLGVFAGEDIGIAEQVQLTSAIAIRTALEQDETTYKNIRAVVFSLPIFDRDQRRRANNPFDVFAEQFKQPHYKGRIPILIADQDMHRLTVTIARYGFVVSELNPADSHGVFGEYWQNRGPAVEEKLALTTVGLLVQHHLINPHVLDPNNYHLV